MATQFDRMIARLGTDSIKWGLYGDDVLPMWVADMDFQSSPEIIAALHERVAHGVYGYAGDPHELKEVFCHRLLERYGWAVSPEAVVMIPDVSVGFNLACQAAGEPGEGIVMHTPIYHPMLRVPGNAGMVGQLMQLDRDADGRYTFDDDKMRRVISPCTRVFLLCSPHNPVGRVWQCDELQRLAQVCLEHELTIVSDEIHCDLVYGGVQHTPIAALSPEVEARTITLMAPSKTFNMAGLKCALAVIPNPELRRRYERARRGLVPGVNVLAYTAALAAYRDSDEWLRALLVYLEGNRDRLARFVADELPGVRMWAPEGTYLAWLDCRATDLDGLAPHEFFLERARVAMNDGADFGAGGEGFVRFNFGCHRATLDAALERLRAALERWA
ncbi:MAG: MalY/PatB family protein [Anaerolineae bacterium]|jgi:cystathionine beta-lyase